MQLTGKDKNKKKAKKPRKKSVDKLVAGDKANKQPKKNNKK